MKNDFRTTTRKHRFLHKPLSRSTGKRQTLYAVPSFKRITLVQVQWCTTANRTHKTPFRKPLSQLIPARAPVIRGGAPVIAFIILERAKPLSHSLFLRKKKRRSEGRTGNNLLLVTFTRKTWPHTSTHPGSRVLGGV